jgi:hypothetical protein
MCGLDDTFPRYFVNTYIPLTLYPRRGSRDVSDIIFSETPTFYQNYLAMKNTAELTGKPIAVCSQSISGVNDVGPLVAFYDIPEKRRGAILFFCSKHHTGPIQFSKSK